MSGRILKEGFLVKSPPLEKSFSQWKKRYFKLWESGRLDYFESNKSSDQQPKGMINLFDAQEVTRPTKREFDRPHCIKIVTKERVFVIQCTSESDQSTWHDEIAKAAAGQSGASSTVGEVASSNPARQTMPLPDIPPDSSVQDDADVMNFATPDHSSQGFAGAHDRLSMPLPSLPPEVPPSHARPSLSGQPPLLPTSPKPILPSGQPLPGFDPTRGGATLPHPGRARPTSSAGSSAPLPRPISALVDPDNVPFARLSVDQALPTDNSVPTLPPRPSMSSGRPPMAEPGPTAGTVPRRRDGYTMVDFSQKPPSGHAIAHPPPSAPTASRTNYTKIDLRKTEDYRQQAVGRADQPLPPPPEPADSRHPMPGENHQESVGYVQMVHPSQLPVTPGDYEKMSGPTPHPAGYPLPRHPVNNPPGRQPAPVPVPRDRKSIRRQSDDVPPELPARRM